METQQPPINNPQTPVPQANSFKDRAFSVAGRLKEQLGPIVTEIKAKVYKNKVLFWTFTSIFGLMLIIIIFGSIYKLKNGSGNQDTTLKFASPTPASFDNTQNKIYDDLTVDEDKLHLIHDSFINYDPDQKRLSPPKLEFELDF